MIGRWLAALRRRRDVRILRQRPIPDRLWKRTLVRYPFLHCNRSAGDVARLRELATLFLARKEFSGPMIVRDDMAVAIAAQACLPILRLGLGCYDGFVGIVVHPDAVQARRSVTDDDGVVHEYDETLAGEALEGGPVMLAWRDVRGAGASARWGYNVVIHEFAHVLDFRAGLTRETRGRWIEALDERFRGFVETVDGSGESWLDPYGAEGIEEFFAVASEAFFVQPAELRERHADVYGLLAEFYRQDPAAGG